MWHVRSALLAIGLVLCLTMAAAHDAAGQTVNATPSPHVYRIKAASCAQEPETRYQTGFRIRGLIGIVTALHGVVSCKSIAAQSGDDTFTNLDIVKVDIERDAALLWSQKIAASGSAGFSNVASTPDARETIIHVIGYPQGATRQKALAGVKVVALAQLVNLIPETSVDVLERRASPAIDIDVYSIQDPLTQGYSGAPLLDDVERIVGIGSSGLDFGRINTAWAVPIRDIQWELVSNKIQGRVSGNARSRLNALATESSPLSSQELEANPGDSTQVSVDACATPWFFTPQPDGCIESYRIAPAEMQVFERGRIVYLGDLSQSFVFFDGASWEVFFGQLEAAHQSFQPKLGNPTSTKFQFNYCGGHVNRANGVTAYVVDAQRRVMTWTVIKDGTSLRNGQWSYLSNASSIKCT